MEGFKPNMKVYQVYPEANSQAITRFGSENVALARLLHLQSEAFVHAIVFSPGGRLGYHPATSSQLFLVVQGEGWVRGQPEQVRPIRAGQAVFWEKGEGHASGTQGGMVAIVIESDRMEPGEFLSPASVPVPEKPDSARNEGQK